MKRLVEHKFSGETTLISTYDATKTSMGTLMCQRSGITNEENWAGPLPALVGRFNEDSFSPGSVQLINLVQYTNDIDWIFLGDSTTSGTTVPRYFHLYEIDKSTWTISYVGNIYLGTGAGTSYRSMFLTLDSHTTGQASVSGTTVTGVGTSWQTDRICNGARIGFGSTNPSEINSWYTIDSITSDTELNISTSGGTIGLCDYVIEEIRMVCTVIGTLAGVVLVKGLSRDSFSNYIYVQQVTSGSDTQHGLYILSDHTSSPTYTAAVGGSLAPKVDKDTQYFYAANGSGTANLQFYVYNIRASLTVSSRISSAFLYKTGIATIHATLQTWNNAFMSTANHGPGNEMSIYYGTTTRMYRIPVKDIVENSTTFIKHAESELPVFGSAYFYVSSGVLLNMWYSSSLDRFFICNTGGFKIYTTKFTGNAQTCETGFTHLSYKFDTTNARGVFNWSDKYNCNITVVESGGVLYSLFAFHILYVHPINVDWQYALSQNQILITPEIILKRPVKMYKAYVNSIKYFGDSIFGDTAEPFKLYARGSGIKDNSGCWVELDHTNDLSAFSSSDSVQLMFTFKVGATGLTSRILSCGVVYEEATTDPHFILDVSKSRINPPVFIWKFHESVGSSIPRLFVRIYDSTNDNLILIDNTDVQNKGEFHKSTDGTTWTEWDSDDRSNDTTYIRYSPFSLPPNLKVDPVLYTGE